MMMMMITMILVVMVMMSQFKFIHMLTEQPEGKLQKQQKRISDARKEIER